MHYGVKLESFGDLWREAMRGSDGAYSRRTVSDDAEREFWATHMRDRASRGAPNCPDEYAGGVRDAVLEILGERRYGSILEIGPGWGNYTFDLAARCEHFSCMDISSDVLAYLRGVSAERGIPIETICCKWEDYRGGPSDVVFAFNCFYRMREIERCLLRIHEQATLRVIGMTSGPEQEYYPAIERELGLEIDYHRLDYIHLLGVLYQLGIDSSLRAVPLVKDYVYESPASAASDAAKRIRSADYSARDVEQIVSRYLHRDAHGKWHYYHRFYAGILYW